MSPAPGGASLSGARVPGLQLLLALASLAAGLSLLVPSAAPALAAALERPARGAGADGAGGGPQPALGPAGTPRSWAPAPPATTHPAAADDAGRGPVAVALPPGAAELPVAALVAAGPERTTDAERPRGPPSRRSS